MESEQRQQAGKLGLDGAKAVRALEEIEAARRGLERHARWSFGRHACVGLIAGSMVAGFALPGAWPIIVAAIGLMSTALVIARDRRRDGFFVSGYRPGQTRRLTFAAVLLTWGALLVAVVLRIEFGLVWAPVVVGIVVALAVTASSILWERVYRRELMETPVGS